MLRCFGILLGMLVAAVDGPVGPGIETWTTFNLSEHTQLLEDLRSLDISTDVAWKASPAKRDGIYPHRTICELESSDNVELVVDSTTYQILHFRRAVQEPAEQEEPEILDEADARRVAESVISSIAPDAQLGPIEVRLIRSGDFVSEWTTYYEFWVQQTYNSYPCRGRSIRVTISAYTGRVLTFTNFVPIPPKNLDHTIAASVAQKLADKWISENVGPAHTVEGVTKPSLELVITEEDRERRDPDIWSRLAWVIVVKFADIPLGFRRACHVYFDPVTGEVFDTSYDRVGKTL